MKPYFERGGISLYHCDARDAIDEVIVNGTVDLLLTDPPYGMQYESQGPAAMQNIRGDGARQGMRVFRSVLFELSHKWHPDAHAYSFCHWEGLPDFYDAMSTSLLVRNALVWDKAAGGVGDTDLDYARDWEGVLYGIRGRGRRLNGRRDGAVLRGHKGVPSARRLHPTEKPISLLAYLIRKSTAPGMLVVDPFAGSASTLEAAKLCGRRAVGFEIDERWCERSAKRLEQEALQIFEELPPRASDEPDDRQADLFGVNATPCASGCGVLVPGPGFICRACVAAAEKRLGDADLDEGT